jgi:serine/threonine protein kinase
VVFLGAKVVDKQKGLILLELLMCSLHRAIYFPDEHNVAWAEPLLKHTMTLQIAQGLAYLHTARPRITHGDMKPANVMLTDRNVCRIIDFGLSVVKESSRMVSHDPRIKAGNGTLHYQAPELLKADTIANRDHKVDVYAYAVTILELFQQQPPYPSAMAVREIETILNRGQRPVVDRVLVPADILALINAAWHQNKEQRPEFTAIVMGLLSFLQTDAGIQAAVAAAEATTSSEVVSDVAVDL